MDTLLEDYIISHVDAEPPHLALLDRRSNLSLVNGRMVSGHLQGRLLKMLTALVAPRRVLELGTFSGYSALCIAEGLTGDAVIDSVEANDELEDFLRREALPLPGGERIRLHIGDACDVMRTLAAAPDFEPYDMVFIDADKREYERYYELALGMTRPGALIIADNTLWDGHVADPAYDRDTQTLGIRRFNDLVAADARVERVILPLRDGLTLIRRL